MFSPIDDFQSTIITDLITRRLPALEPRITLQSVQTLPGENEQEYTILIGYDVESLDMYGITLRSLINSNGYTITTE